MNYTIGAFSKEVGLSIDTLRYYEKEKLILP
ncbi:MerR family DNA-binding transcriptional regulator, partial [Listeria innocua]|nr:MerR family DNA-binding transcriptional regulator [Listeria innocua]